MAGKTIQKISDLLSATGKATFTRNEIIEVARQNGLSPDGFLNSKDYRVERGVYSASPVKQVVGSVTHLVPAAPSMTTVELSQPKLKVEVKDLVPPTDPTFVPFGFYKDLSRIIESKAFYPTFISGLSGNGKTTMIEQACANLKRECIRVNISIETDEDDLIGGNTLVDGNVVYRKGPVTIAMERGAVLILDEIDRGSNKLMCIQAIMEGKPYFNKKTGETIYPQPGFNIFGTANTKGQGSEDGKYISAQILDDAFLERFAITVEQEYPSSSVEKKIILKKMKRADCEDLDFATKLVSWAEIIRKTFMEGAIDELISTRRLEHIVNAYAMFGDRLKAIKLCTARFNDETKLAFLDLYTKVDADVAIPAQVEEEVSAEVPF